MSMVAKPAVASGINTCKGNAMYVLYTDDSILAGPDPKELDQILLEMSNSGLDITSEGGIEDFLGVSIKRHEDGSFLLTQQRLIHSILDDLNLLGDNVAIKATPMASSKLLSRHPSSPAFDDHFHYRRVIGKMMYLEKSTRPDLAYAVHQCACFSHDPKLEHGQAVKWIGRYLKGTLEKGLIIRPQSDSLDLFVDSDLLGTGILKLLTMIPVLPTLAMDTSSSTVACLSSGLPNCNLSVLSPLLKLSTLHFPGPSKILYCASACSRR